MWFKHFQGKIWNRDDRKSKTTLICCSSKWILVFNNAQISCHLLETCLYWSELEWMEEQQQQLTLMLFRHLLPADSVLLAWMWCFYCRNKKVSQTAKWMLVCDDYFRNHGICTHVFIWLYFSGNKSWFCSSFFSFGYWMKRWITARLICPSLHLPCHAWFNFMSVWFFLAETTLFCSFYFSCPSHICRPSLRPITPFERKNEKRNEWCL